MVRFKIAGEVNVTSYCLPIALFKSKKQDYLTLAYLPLK